MAPIPLPLRSKNPGYPKWQDLRVTEGTLDSYFPPGVAKNIGILNGEPSANQLDVDLDWPEASRVAELFLPVTGCVFGRQSALRSHRIFRTYEPLKKASIKLMDPTVEDEKRAAILELRGNRGHTVFPPSAHEETGEAVFWERFLEPAQGDLSDLQRCCRKLAACALLARHWPARGTRDEAAMALHAALARAGWTVEQIGHFIAAVAVAAGDEEIKMRAGKAPRTAEKLGDGHHLTGWPTLAGMMGDAVVDQVRRWLGLEPQFKFSGTAKGASEQSKASVRAAVLPPYREFPLDTLPPVLGNFVAQGAASMKCDPSYIALPVLSVVASLIGNTRVIQLKRKWFEPSVVWTAIIGDSGTLKSPAADLAVEQLFRHQGRLSQEFANRYAVYELEKATYDASRKRLSKNPEAVRQLGAPPEEPCMPRLVVSDTTIEKLIEILGDNPRGVMLYRDELNGWLTSFTRYKGKGGATDLPLWLPIFRAGPIFYDRKSNGPGLYVPRAAVSITGGIQPEVFASVMAGEFRQAGLCARLAMVMPLAPKKAWSEAEIDGPVLSAYEFLVDSLFSLHLDTDDAGMPSPYAVQLSAEAKRYWVEFYDDFAEQQAGAEGELKACYSKLEAYAARFSLLHHVVTKVGRGEDLDPVGLESLKAGVALATWFAVEARRIYGLLGETPDLARIRRLVEFIRTHGGRITSRRLQRSNPAKYRTSDQAQAALEELVQVGLADWRETPSTEKGGRQTRFCVLRPDADPPEELGDDDEVEPPTDPKDPKDPPDTTSGGKPPPDPKDKPDTTSGGGPSRPGGSNEARSTPPSCCAGSESKENGAVSVLSGVRSMTPGKRKVAVEPDLAPDKTDTTDSSSTVWRSDSSTSGATPTNQTPDTTDKTSSSSSIPPEVRFPDVINPTPDKTDKTPPGMDDSEPVV
jgi:hypothetical protein